MGAKALFALLVGCLVEISFGAITFSFEGGVPADWGATSQWRAYAFDGSTYLRTNIASSNAGTTGLVKSNVSVEEELLPTCNNVVAEVVLSNTKPVTSGLIDSFQVVISTDNWQTEIPVGEPFEYYDASSSDTWAVHRVVAPIDGLSDCSQLYVGLRVIAAGWSSNHIYVKSISFDFLSGATCSDIGFANGIEPKIGDRSVMVQATVNKEPEEAISELSVWAVVDRNGFIYTNQMFEAGANVYTNDIIGVDATNSGSQAMPALDAGDWVRVEVLTRYVSSMGAIGTPDEINPGAYIETSVNAIDYQVAQQGSVWINEFTLSKVELCGTTNRYYMPGWKLVLLDGSSAIAAEKVFEEAFDFSANMPNKMVGLLVYDLAWKMGTLNNPYSLQLVNSAGIVEHRCDNLILSGGDSIFGMTGIADWPEEGEAYDWSGTATNGTFRFAVIGNETFGKLNDGQYFEIENTGWFSVNTYVSMKDGVTPGFQYANVDYALDFSGGAINGALQTGENGSTPIIEFTGTHTNLESVAAEFAVSAFGWLSDPVTYNLNFGMTNDSNNVVLSPTIAKDDFSDGKLGVYWENTGTRTFKYGSADDNGFARFDSRTANNGSHYAVIRCSNPVMTRGKSNVSVSFSVMNYVYGDMNVVDYAYVQIATNIDFSTESIIVQSASVSNKITGVATGVWNKGKTVVKLPGEIDESIPLYVRIRGEAGGWSSAYLDVDDLKIAFQDVAMPTDLRLTADELKHGGITGFELDVLPQTADKVADVSADLHLTLNGVEQVIPFAFPNSERVTNDLSRVEGEAKPVTLSISGEALADALGGPFLSGDEVSYYAAVHYDAANGATDPAERYETRFFPDNSTASEIDGTTYWVVEGDYGVAADLSANTFTVSGAPLSCIGEPVVTTDGVSFDLHGYAAAGITNLTVSLNGKDYAPFEGLETNAQVRVTGTFALPEMDKLDANTEYVVTIAATDANGEAIEPSVFTIVTLPTVTGATITGLSADTVRLTASGNAAGFVAPAEWTQTGARAWERSGIAPNTRVEATVFATNKVGAASVGSVTAAGYTLAAVATKAPVIEKGVTTVTVGADHTASADGNPEATEYAVRVTTSAGGEATSAWKTLTQWREVPETFAVPMIDLEATNSFSFVTRNADGAVTANPTPVTTNCWFEMTARFEPESVVQVADPYGTVQLGLAFGDPAQGADATATVEYKLGEDGAWTPLCADFNVVFDEQLSMTTNLAWDAWTAVGGVAGTYAYTLRTRVVSGTRASEWVEVADTLDFAAPTGLAIAGTPAPGAVTADAAFSLAATATDATAVTYRWTFNGVESTGATLTGTAREGANEARVYAVDALGNKSAAVTRTWTLDTTAPTGLVLSGTPASGAVTAEAAFSLAATATDATAVTYHWTFNGVESTGATLTGTAREGANEASVCAVDAAGNKSAAVTRTWTLDTTAPTGLVLSGTPASGAVTAEAAFSLAATATDATAVTYRWTFNGVESTGATLTGTAREGANEVSVCAVDAAGNKSAAVTRTWTLDTTAPTGLAISGTPAPGAVTAEAAFSLAATATDATAVTYRWTFDGVESTGATLTGTAREGANEASVCAVDAAGNKSAAVTRTWTLDTTAPTRPVIGGEPAAGGTTNTKAFRFFAESTDATAVTYHWTFDGVESTGATLTGTAREGANTASVYAVDAAGNKSAAATRSWTVDTVAPTVELASASPAYLKEGETLTVTATFSEEVTGFTAAAVTVVNGTAQVSGSGAVYAIAVSPTADGVVSVRIAADAVTDLAGNGNAASAMLTRTYDTVAPEATLTRVTTERFNTAPMTVLVELSERVTNDFTLAALAVENGTIAAIEAVADTPNAYRVAVTPAEEGEVSVQVTANALFDVVGHGNVASAKLACIYDVTKPTVEIVSETPDPFKAGSVFTLVATFSEAVTNFTAEAVTVVNGTAQVAGSGAAYTIAVTPEEDGEVSVRIAADTVADAAGNGNEPSEKIARLYDGTRPSVTLASETRDPFNGTDVFTVVATFSEAVTNFTAEAVTAGNGTVGEIVPLTGEGYTNAYSFVVTPEHDGEVTVAIAADAVTDLAGNGNAASETLVRTCDVTPPTVTFTSSTTDYFNADNTALIVTATFSEPIAEEITADAFNVRHGKIGAFSGSGMVYALTLVPDGEGEIAVRLKAGVATDAADNANVESGEFVRVNDTTSPTDLSVAGVPQGETSERRCRLVASATDKSPVRYQWLAFFNGVRVALTTTAAGVAFEREFDGAGTVRIVVQPVDAANNYGEQKSFTWTIVEGGESGFSDVAFGDDVSLPVDSETGATNRVTFTSVAFRPGAESTFTLQGFAAKQTEIANLNMWLVVRETLAGPSWRVALESTATYDAAAGTLTVTLPATALQRADGTPFGSLFITGIDNQNQE